MYAMREAWRSWSVDIETDEASSISFNEMLLPPIIYLLLYFNSCLNPLLYALLSENFRRGLRDLFYERFHRQ